MTNETEDVRCTTCGKLLALLARLRDGVLTIQRGELLVTFDGDFHASFVCQQARCRRLNVVRVRSHRGHTGAFP